MVMEQQGGAVVASRSGRLRRLDVDTVDIDGFPLVDLDEAAFVRLVIAEASEGRGGWVITPNADILRQAHRDAELRGLLRAASVLVADGMPLVWASRLQRTPLHGGRICGSDLMLSVPAAAAEAGLSLFLLGGADDTAEVTARELVRRHPGLRIAGTLSPPLGFESRPEELVRMREAIAAARPDFVFVALGFPKCDRLVARIRDAAPGAWWIGVGAAFDFVAGRFRRAPALMQRTGTEWLYRMLQEPGRLVRRYLWHDLPFVAMLLAGALWRGLVRRRRVTARARDLAAAPR